MVPIIDFHELLKQINFKVPTFLARRKYLFILPKFIDYSKNQSLHRIVAGIGNKGRLNIVG